MYSQHVYCTVLCVQYQVHPSFDRLPWVGASQRCLVSRLRARNVSMSLETFLADLDDLNEEEDGETGEMDDLGQPIRRRRPKPKAKTKKQEE